MIDVCLIVLHVVVFSLLCLSVSFVLYLLFLFPIYVLIVCASYLCFLLLLFSDCFCPVVVLTMVSYCFPYRVFLHVVLIVVCIDFSY